MSSLSKVHLALVALIILFIGLSLQSSLIRPFTSGPDEVAHFQFIRFVSKYHRLPVSWEEREEGGYKSDWPPLFHLVAGMVGSGIDLDSPPFIKIAQDNPRLQLVVGNDNLKSWRVINTEDPFQGEKLLWYVGRWVTILFGVIGIIAVYLLIRALYPQYPWVAFGAAALLAFNSTYLFISSVISYEPLLGAILTFYFLLLFYTLQYPDRNWLYFVLGLLMGLAGFTRYTVFPAVPVLSLLVIWLGYRNKWGWRLTGWRLLLTILGVVLTLGVWVLYMLIYFNQIAELGLYRGLLNLFLIGDNSDDTSLRIADAISGGAVGGFNSLIDDGLLLEWIQHTYRGFWNYGYLGLVLWGVWLIAVIGLVKNWRRQSEQMRLWLVLLVMYVGLFWLLPFLRFFMSRQVPTGMAQHVLFPAAAIMIVLFVVGLKQWLRGKRLAQVLLILAALLFAQQVTQVAKSSEPPLPIQTVPISADEKPLALFGDLSLVDFEYLADDQALETTLIWRAEQLLNEDFRVELTLLDMDNQPQARWIGQPVNGHYPTRSWSPDDRVRDQIQLPISALPPGDYEIQLRIVGESGPIAPTVPVDVLEQLTIDGDPLTLGYVSLAPSPSPLDDTILLDGQEIGFGIWPQSADLPNYGERATVLVYTDKPLADDIRLRIVGPDGQAYEAIEQTMNIYNFGITPRFANGEYHLLFEQLRNDEVVAQAESSALFRVKVEDREFEIGPISHPVNANFAGRIALLGYDLPQPRVQAGESLPVTLHWQALKTMEASFTIFSNLTDDQQQIWGKNERLPRDIYSTMLWAPDEIVSDSFSLQVDPNAPDGIYHLMVGLYLPVGESAVSLPLVQDGQLSDITAVRIGPIKVGQTSPEFTVDTADPQFPLHQKLGDTPNLTLLGYDLANQPNHVALTLFWQVESPLNVDYTTFVHLRNRAGETIAQQDQPPLNGLYPTSLWDAGEIIVDTINLPLPDQLPDNGYKVVVGLYDFQTGRRLVVSGSVANEIVILEVE